ncbi:glycosyltransferase [Kribbella sp.]|uniref:glycosyltransferase n=1 Tax=Kribbella sp. TaxID=1871183 RepID=UPI002D433DED|nr:glycosyltransferase [Kribbella sp.]HZX05932.1 glycosyltransferase [Kribbella sp.]
MRFVLASWGSRGDVEPLAGLAVALQGLGAEATVCVPPEGDFEELLARAGVPMEPLGPSVRSVVTAPKPASGRHPAFELAARLVAARFETLGRVAPGADAIVATGLMPAGARDVADKLGIGYVLAGFHLGGIPSQHFAPGARPGTPTPDDVTDRREQWEYDAQRVNELYGPALNEQRAAIGLPPVGNVRDYVFTEHPWLAADPTLCPSAGMTDLDVVQTGAWILPDDRPLPDDLQAFLEAGEPPVYVGFGSMAAYAPKDIARTVIEASQAHGRRVLLSRGWAELNADNCFVVGEVNQQALFPRVAAIVHHGGAGTTTTAARAGVPQVVVPLIADQPYWASRVVALGIGAADEAPTVDSLSATLGTALASEARAREVSGMIKTDGATVAAKLLIEKAQSTGR